MPTRQCVCAIALLVGCGARTSLESAPFVDANRAAPELLPNPPNCLENDLPSLLPLAQDAPIGLRVFDSSPCEPWPEPMLHRTWSPPPTSAPRLLWRSASPIANYSSISPSSDGSVWVYEYHPSSAVRAHNTIAVYERDGALRWRSRALCALHPTIAVGPDGVGIVTASQPLEPPSRERNRSIVFRLSPAGQLLGGWPAPERSVFGFVVRSGPVLFSARADGVIASCRGERPLWVRTLTPTDTSCSRWTSVHPQADGTVWASSSGGVDPTLLDARGAVLDQLPRTSPLAASTQIHATSRIVGTADPQTTLVAERTEFLDCWSTYANNATVWQNGQRIDNVDLNIAQGIDLLWHNFELSPDLSIWSLRQSTSLERFVAGKLVWRRDDLPPNGVNSWSRYAADGSRLGTYRDRARRTTFLARVRADGVVAWAFDLVDRNGVSGNVIGVNTFEVTPDGIVYLEFRGELLAIQTDFVPARRTGDFVLPNGVTD